MLLECSRIAPRLSATGKYPETASREVLLTRFGHRQMRSDNVTQRTLGPEVSCSAVRGMPEYCYSAKMGTPTKT